MMTVATCYGVTAVTAVSLALAVPLQGQSTGPSHAGYDPTATMQGHYHEGELGQKFMLLETALKCQCGCGLDVHSCQFQMQCAESPAWSRRIRESLEAGESAEVIQASFVADFGGQVLMMPPAEGFNILGYLLPALAIVSAGMMAVLVARGGQNEKTLAPVNQVSDEDAEKLRAAMRKLDEAESPDW
jgi:cytochrome c-type biogenesis protein CcmH/NrfF